MRPVRLHTPPPDTLDSDRRHGQPSPDEAFRAAGSVTLLHRRHRPDELLRQSRQNRAARTRPTVLWPRRPAPRPGAGLQGERRRHGDRSEHRAHVGQGEGAEGDMGRRGRRCGLRVATHADWRMPTIKELYSLINFSGGFHFRAVDSKPYIDTVHFGFVYGDASKGERGIDCQDWSATQYVGTTMNGNPTVFGVNFADGRIKGYPKVFPAAGPTSLHPLRPRQPGLWEERLPRQ